MRNIKLTIEYDGSKFSGWQRQGDVRTVQGVVENAVERVFSRRAPVVGAGRTDAGVHAVDYPCNFHVDTELATERIAAALSAHLPEDVVVKDASDVRPDFDARFDALSRRYEYRISTARTALWRHVYHTPHVRLDPDRMQDAAACLAGEHDFTSFTPSANRAQPVCRVLELGFRQEGALLTFAIEANRFIHHMVRIIVGTLIDVGRGRIEPERVETILCRRDRRVAGPTAPPKGLALVAVRYPDGIADCR